VTFICAALTVIGIGSFFEMADPKAKAEIEALYNEVFI